MCTHGGYLLDAPPAIKSYQGRDRLGAPFWAQSMDLAIHVLEVLLNAARNHHVIRPINIANYARKFLSPIEELQRSFLWFHERHSWTHGEHSRHGCIVAFKIMVEVSEFMCITAPFLDFGEGVPAYADRLLANILADRANHEKDWEPSHDLKRMIVQDEWAKMNGIDVWFPQTCERLVACSVARDARLKTS